MIPVIFQPNEKNWKMEYAVRVATSFFRLHWMCAHLFHFHWHIFDELMIVTQAHTKFIRISLMQSIYIENYMFTLLSWQIQHLCIEKSREKNRCKFERQNLFLCIFIKNDDDFREIIQKRKMGKLDSREHIRSWR